MYFVHLRGREQRYRVLNGRTQRCRVSIGRGVINGADGHCSQGLEESVFAAVEEARSRLHAAMYACCVGAQAPHN